MSFINSFEMAIAEGLNSDKDKLQYLEQFTVGEPQEVVRACLLMEASEGYKEARRLLHQMYGRTHCIAAAYVDKIISWPNMKIDDIKSMRKLSVLVRSCYNALISLPQRCGELDHASTMRKIVDKFPISFRDRWMRKAHFLYETDQRPPLFRDLVEFIEMEVASL